MGVTTMRKAYKNLKSRTRGNINHLINNMDQDIYGLSCASREIFRYLKTKEEFLIFEKCVKDAVEIMKIEYPGLNESMIWILDSFQSNVREELEKMGIADE
jgi:hypothetical protein